MDKLTYRQKLTMLERANRHADDFWQMGLFPQFKKFSGIAMETHTDNRLINS